MTTEPTREEIEAAARASFDAGAKHAADEHGLSTPVAWSDLTDWDREHIRLQARAALIAAREVRPEATIKAEALREVADEAADSTRANIGFENPFDYHVAAEWLYARADAIEGGGNE